MYSIIVLLKTCRIAACFSRLTVHPEEIRVCHLVVFVLGGVSGPTGRSSLEDFCCSEEQIWGTAQTIQLKPMDRLPALRQLCVFYFG